MSPTLIFVEDKPKKNTYNFNFDALFKGSTFFKTRTINNNMDINFDK